MKTPYRATLLFLFFLLSGSIQADAQISAGFTFTPLNGCSPQVVQFTNTSTGTISSYTWNFGNGAPNSYFTNPSTSYTSPGTYYVTLTVSGPSGTKTASATVIIYPPPIVSLTFSPSIGCAPLAVSFTASVIPGVAGPLTFHWDFGDGFTSTNSSPTHNYNTPGTYTPKVTVTNSKGCAATYVSTNTITVLAGPTISFSAFPNLYCAIPATASFSSSVSGSGGFTYLWNFGDGGTATSSSPANIYTTVGNFTVKLYVTDGNGCKDSVIKPAYISTQSVTPSFSGPTSICQARSYSTGASPKATFNNTTTGASLPTTYWNYGDGAKDTGGSVSHAYMTAGVYTVTMTTTVSGCTYTKTSQITVNANPGSSFTYGPIPNCPPPTTLQFTASGATSYQWSWSSGGSSSLNNPSHIYTTAPLRDTVTLIGTNAAGCKDTIRDEVIVHDMIFGYTGETRGCAPFTVTYTMTLKSSMTTNGLYPGFPNIITSYHWDFGDGNTSTVANPTHTYTNVGTYNRILTITTSNGCTQSNTVQIFVGAKHKPSFTFFPDTVCTRVPVYFTNTTSQVGVGHLTFSWSLGQAYTMINGRDALVSYSVPGIYDVILYADSNGCVDSAMCRGCLVVHPPNANFTDSVYCAPNSTTVAFKNQSIGPTSNRWSFGDGDTSILSAPVHTYPGPGTYNVKLITNNSIYGCSDTLTVPVRVAHPVFSFAAADSALCLGDTLKLYPTYTGVGQVMSSNWAVDTVNNTYNILSGSITNLNGAAFIMSGYTISNNIGLYYPIGFHTVRLVVVTRNPGAGTCTDTLIKPYYVSVSKPSAGFMASPLITCTPSPVLFTDTSKYTPGMGANIRLWRFGDGDTSSTSSLSTSHTYLTSGSYTVKLIITDVNGCKDSAVKPNYVQSRKPYSWFQVPGPNGCVKKSITFTNLSTGATSLTANWYFGDGDTAASFFTVHHAYRSPGTYIVRLVVFDGTGCSDTSAQLITITSPKAAFSLSDTLTVCPPLIVIFTSTSTNAVSYSWDFKNSGFAAIPNPVSTFTAPGVYNVMLVVSDINGCNDTATATVRVLGYAGALSYAPLKGCHPMTVNFSSQVSNAPFIVWDFADGTTMPGVGLTASHTYLTPGAYIPKLIFKDGSGCAASSIGVDTIKVDGVVAGFKALAACEKTPVQLVDTSHSYFSAMKDWHWNFGPAGTVTGNPVTHTFGPAGTYSVTLIATNNQGCKDTVQQLVVVSPLPKIQAMDDTSVCIPDSIPLSAQGGMVYAWAPGATLSCTSCPHPIASPVIPTNYIVTGTDSLGCMNKDTVRIGIQTKSTFVTVASGEICLGKSFQLFAAGATVYNWTPTETLDDPNSAHPLASPKVNTTYIVTGKEGSCLADTHSVRVIVRPLPFIDAGTDVKAIAGRGTLLQASGTGISRVEWTKDSSLSCLQCFAPQATPRVTTTYYITAFNDYGCTSMDSVKVTVLCDGSQLYIPNTFSPNSDGKNDMFFPRGVGIDHINSFRVYSRWGELLFERTHTAVNDEKAGWNGSFGGRILNPDVYVYIIEATCDTGEPIKFKGDVTLIR